MVTEGWFMPQLETLLNGTIRQELAFPNTEYQSRVSRVTREMKKRGIDLLITASNPSICYLTGFQYTNTDYSNFLLLRSDGQAGMVVAGTEVATVVVHGWIRDVKEFASWNPVEALPLVSSYVRDWGLSECHIGLDQRFEVLDPRAYRKFADDFPDAKISDASDIVIGCRKSKSAMELGHLQKAAYYTDIGMLAAIAAAKPGNTENDVAAAASEAMILSGSEYFSTAPLVSAGRRTGLPRATFKRAKIAAGESVTIELAGVFQRYSAPLSTSVISGKPTRLFTRLADSSIDCLRTLMDCVELKRPINDVAKLLRRKLRPLAEDIAPLPSFGCSIGVSLAPSWREEWLLIDESSPWRFEEGMVFYSPIRLCIPGQIGVCFGESWFVTAAGAKRLSNLPLAPGRD
jgi:Xaa-Pro dipeptidase